MRSDDHGQEAFAMFTEDLWSGLPSFGWRCSMRCWVYVLARNAVKRFAAAPARQRERNLPLSQHQSQLAQHETGRPKTAPHQDTSIKDRMRALRDRLSQEEQMLLVLHVDRRLTWPEIALVLHDAGGILDQAEQAREAARLRKRFERLKVELRRLAVEDGLLRR
jgi:RNA polymerase sigma-70 factor (ECF subfamily)